MAKDQIIDDPAEEPLEVVADAVEESAPDPEPVEEPEGYVSPMMVDALAGEQVVFPMPQSEQAAVVATEG